MNPREDVPMLSLTERATARLAATPCPRCGVAEGRLAVTVGMAARPLGSHSLAGAQPKVSAREVPVLACSGEGCGFRITGVFEPAGASAASATHASFPHPEPAPVDAPVDAPATD